MKRHIAIFITAALLSGPAFAAEAEVNAQANVQTESEAGFFTRAWTGVKDFFGFSADEQATTEAETEAEASVQAEAEDGSLIDKAADGTKAGVEWTADKAKKGAEWTKDTAIDVKDDAVGGAKAVGGAVKEGASKVGGAVKGVFTSDAEVEADAQVSAESK